MSSVRTSIRCKYMNLPVKMTVFSCKKAVNKNVSRLYKNVKYVDLQYVIDYFDCDLKSAMISVILSVESVIESRRFLYLPLFTSSFIRL